MNDNDKTVQAYNDNIDEYLGSMAPSLNDDIKRWIDRLLNLVPAGGTILELGSGAGRDAAYMESRGFRVITSDAAQGFVDKLKQAGHEARLINALTDDYGTGYDMVFADAVLLHFSPEQCETVLKKARQSLKTGGLIAFSVKQGSGSNWLTEKIAAARQFYYWQRPQLEEFLKASAFSIVEITEGRSRSASWYYVTLKKT